MLADQSVERNPKNLMLGRRETTDGKVGPYAWLTYQEAYDKAIRIGSAMRASNVNPACNSHGIYYVPLYDTLGANAVEFIINHAEISIAFIQENKIDAVSQFRQSMTPRNDSLSDNEYTEMHHTSEEYRLSALEKLPVPKRKKQSWLERLGSEDCELPPKNKDDICTIMYTSGTTGDPKGVLLSNGAIMTEVMTIDDLLRETDKVDVRYLVDDIQALKPTIFCGVPRVYDRIYTGIKGKISTGGAVKRSLFHCAYGYKLRNMESGMKQDKAAPFCDKIIFSKIKEGLGGRVRILLSGAAPLPKHIEEFLRVTSCSVLIQGYGLTESSAGCFTAIANVFSMMGTVGVPVTAIEARLESVPDMGYDALAEVPRGEICLRGKTLFSGYYKRPDLTEEVLIDGWFHTGDIGEWQPNGAMKIIDRKKNIFKLSQGEYIAVENIESTYGRCPLITSIWVYGNSFESFLVAVVIPERKALEDWASMHNEGGDFESLCRNPKARKYFLDELNNTGRKHNLRGFEMIKGVHLEPNPFDMERDLITPTFKLKRPQLLQYYKEHIDELYSEARGTKA
ncbi:eukaryotic long-chain fatty acid CoA synthetase (LC-FACS) [Asimina triloba]